MRRTAIMLIVILLSLWSLKAQKAGLVFDNQIGIWLGQGFNDPLTSQAGALYIPTLSPKLEFANGAKLDAEISVKAYGNLLFEDFSYDTVNHSFKPYRAWIRYSTSNFELRAGLQKINFGSSTILRPLMWFDRMDYRDPLQLTNGVWGLLARYFFNNNTNVWLWGLYGNEGLKGWEIAPSVKDIPEFGGRLQLPVPAGEAGISYNHRTADYNQFYTMVPVDGKPYFREDQFGIDAKFDIGPGIALEYVGKLNDIDNILFGRWENYFSIGVDYTFSLGNGLYLLTEYFHFSDRPPEGQEKTVSNYSTLSLSYPVSLSHNLSGAVYYNWETGDWSRFLNLQLKYDYLSFNIMGFWNPDTFSLYNGGGESYFFAGKGLQVMLVLDI
ncbi:MAG: hypothetical protein MUE32_08245 [Bacteroidales bacterium]|jgi:hypothetical protein|nr:hypothetical protein [Bacteroidales bacterium]